MWQVGAGADPLSLWFSCDRNARTQAHHPLSKKSAAQADSEVLLMRMFLTIQDLKTRTRRECVESFETDGAQVSTTSRRRDWAEMNGLVAGRGQRISLAGGFGSKTLSYHCQKFQK